MRSLSTITFLSLSIGSSIASAGVVMVTRGRSPGYGPGSGSTTVYLEGNRLRIENQSTVGMAVVLFDGEAKVARFLDLNAHAYAERTEEDARRDRAQIEGQFANLPASQRKLAEERAATPRGAVQFEGTGARRTISGFRCEDHRIKREGKLIGEACLIPWTAAGVTREEFAVLGQFVAAMRGGRMAQDDMLDASTFPGVAALYRAYGADGRPGREEELVSLKKQSLPSEQFLVPPQFTLRGRDPNAKMPALGQALPRTIPLTSVGSQPPAGAPHGPASPGQGSGPR